MEREHRLDRCRFGRRRLIGTRLATTIRVTVRITVIENRPLLRLRVEGRLTCDEIEELELLIGSGNGAACLELTDLRSADAVALASLRRLRAQGVQMIHVPRHLAWRIEEE